MTTERKGVTRRVDKGRGGHSYKLDGQTVDGVTTVIGNGVPKPALSYWAAREVAEFAVHNRDTIAALDDSAAVDLLKNAPWRERDKAARRGTEVHGLSELIIAGSEVTVPDELLGHVDSYLQFLKDFDVNPILVEAVVINRRHMYMGTLDLVAELNDGHRWLLDIKTTRSGIYPETALQLAAYRHAETYLDPDGKERPMPTVDNCGAIWVRADGYDLVPVTADADVYRYFRAAQWVANFQTNESRLVIGDVLQAVS